MTQVSTAGGLLYPLYFHGAANINAALANGATLNATTDKIAMIGYCYIDGRAASKTMGGGSSAISFRSGTVTFANGSSTLDIGVQDVATGSGPPAEPDGTFDAKVTLTGSGLSSAAWNNIAIPDTGGTKSVANGQLIAVVWDFTNRAGADSVIVQVETSSVTNLPVTNTFDASAWAAGTEQAPNVVLTFSDGTLGTLEGAGIYTSQGVETFADSSNPDERGNIFQVPWDCKVDAVWAMCGITDANTDFTVSLYSDPLGTPSALDTVTVIGENFNGTGSQVVTIFPFDAEISLTKNTDYVAAIRATGSSNCRLAQFTVDSASYWALLGGGTNANKAARDGGSGAFAETSTTRYPMGVRISSFDDGTGTGSSSKNPYSSILQPGQV